MEYEGDELYANDQEDEDNEDEDGDQDDDGDTWAFLDPLTNLGQMVESILLAFEFLLFLALDLELEW